MSVADSSNRQGTARATAARYSHGQHSLGGVGVLGLVHW